MLSEMQLLKAATQQAHSQQLPTTGTGASTTARTPGTSRVEVFPLAQWGLDENSAEGKALGCVLWYLTSPALSRTLHYHLWC